ncbi:sigma-70 family RNA polymerase sigma factor [Viscerimonas tarda]
MRNTEDYMGNFYRENYNKAKRYAASLVGDGELAQDIASESILKLLEMKDQIDSNKSIHYLFISIIRNKCMDYRRREQVRTKIFEQLPFEQLSPTGENKLFDTEIKVILHAKLKQLPEKSRKIFLGIRMYGKTYQEMADELSITHRCVEYELNKTTIELKKSLSKYVY